MTRRRKVILAVAPVVLAALWFLGVDEFYFCDVCGDCHHVLHIRQLRAFGIPVWHAIDSETQTPIGQAAQDLVCPCPHREIDRVPIERRWGLLIPQFLHRGTLVVQFHPEDYARISQKVRALGARDPNVGREFQDRVIFRHDMDYWHRFLDSFESGDANRAVSSQPGSAPRSAPSVTMLPTGPALDDLLDAVLSDALVRLALGGETERYGTAGDYDVVLVNGTKVVWPKTFTPRTVHVWRLIPYSQYRQAKPDGNGREIKRLAIELTGLDDVLDNGDPNGVDWYHTPIRLMVGSAGDQEGLVGPSMSIGYAAKLVKGRWVVGAAGIWGHP
jgi:hypothetical protein